MLYPKFIIENDSIIMSKVGFHRELATNYADVIGGGLFAFDSVKNVFILFGESFEFGGVSVDALKQCVENDKVYSNKSKRLSIANKYKFKYQTQSGETIDLN